MKNYLLLTDRVGLNPLRWALRVLVRAKLLFSTFVLIVAFFAEPVSVVEGHVNTSMVEDDGSWALFFAVASVLVVGLLGLFGYLLSRRLGSHSSKEDSHHITLGLLDPDFKRHEEVLTPSLATSDHATDREVPTPSRPTSDHATDREVPTPNLPTSDHATNSEPPEQTPANDRKETIRPSSKGLHQYGEHRIDQEVNKLVLGQSYRIDVLSSRFPDDRNAIEASLIKAIGSSSYDDAAHEKAREALEEYGFVARKCAALLMAPDAFERMSAARSLGEMKSLAGLPFLLEALYDSESIVRSQAVISIGVFRTPTAISALLDLAKRHPEMPSSLVSRALSACSVEGVDFFGPRVPRPKVTPSRPSWEFIFEITQLEPVAPVKELPETSDDPAFEQAMTTSASHIAQERSRAIRSLGRFHVQQAVSTLWFVARSDIEPEVRASAISSLASINHESVFQAILVAMADSSPLVRAAAARSLSRLSFDRADAYVRVMENTDAAALEDVAEAVVEAGILSQSIDRLSKHDRRQAYETLSLMCLLAKANKMDGVLWAIAYHYDTDVRKMAIHLLAMTGDFQVLDQLRQLAIKDSTPEDVKSELLDAIYKLDQIKGKALQAGQSEVNENDVEPAGESIIEQNGPEIRTEVQSAEETENNFEELKY